MIDEGITSLQVSGSGFMEITSPAITTATARMLIPSNTSALRLAYDLFIPSGQLNPSWFGATQMYVSCPSAGLYNVYLGQVELNSFILDKFNPAYFQVPDVVLNALISEHNDFTIKIVLNINGGSPPFYMDNLRFVTP